MVTGDGLKTIDAVRDTFEVTTIPADIDAFDERFAPVGVYEMAVTVKLPTQLRDAAGGATSVAVEGGTVGEALNGLYDEHSASCASGSPTATARCGASSTCI